MRYTGATVVCLALLALWPSGAAARPGHGPREDINQTFTSARPNTPTGIGWRGVYHAAGNKRAKPPYLYRMVFYPPKGMPHLDTSVPARCTASNAVLQVQGPAACPAGSQVAVGTTDGFIYDPLAQLITFDKFHHTIYVMNNTNEQILLVKAEGYAVVRGKIRPDGSQDYRLPTCFPEPPTGCLSDHVLQTASQSKLARFTRSVNGRVRSYATTPPRCPASAYWRTRVKYWWKGGAVDTVVTKQRCRSG
jgi:hypothetical protein